MVQRGEVRFHHISTDELITNILIDTLQKGMFLVLRAQHGPMDVALLGNGTN